MHQCNHAEKKGITLAVAKINFREKYLVLGTKHWAAFNLKDFSDATLYQFCFEQQEIQHVTNIYS